MIRQWIGAERGELADLLAGLTAEQWNAPSLCEGWAVRHVVAHLTMPFRYSTAHFLLRMAMAGGSFQRMSDRVALRDGELPRAELVAAVADNTDHSWKPPGGGFIGALTHDVIHGLDISRALGLELAVPVEPMAAVLDSVAGSRSSQYFGVHLDGVRLVATDLDWSSGAGPLMRGRGQDLALLLTGRRLPQGAVTGDGVRLLPGIAGRLAERIGSA